MIAEDSGRGTSVFGHPRVELARLRAERASFKQHQGTCMPAPKGTDPNNDCQGKDVKCGGKCDGAGKCEYPSVGTACGAGPCKACDGTGSCNKAPLDDPACGTIDCDGLDTKCKDYSDLTSARCTSFGKCKAANDPKTCDKVTDLECREAGLEPARDLGAQPHVDIEDGVDDGGCSCTAAGGLSSVPGGPEMLLAFLVLALLRRRCDA